MALTTVFLEGVSGKTTNLISEVSVLFKVVPKDLPKYFWKRKQLRDTTAKELHYRCFFMNYPIFSNMPPVGASVIITLIIGVFRNLSNLLELFCENYESR